MKSLLNLRNFVKPYWKESLISLVLLTAVVIMDLAIPRLVQRIIDQGILRSDADVVLKTTLTMLGISLTSTIFAIGNNNYSIRAGEGFARDLREAMFLKIQSYSFGNLDRLRTGELIVRLTSDVGALQRVVQIFLRIGTRAPLLMLGSLLLMFNTNPRLALILLPILILTGIAISFFVARVGPMFRQVQRKLDQVNTVLQENIAGVRVVKAFVRADHELLRFDGANQAYTQNMIRVSQINGLMSPVLTILVNAGVVVVIWSGGLQAINGSLSVGEIIAFSNYLMTTMMPLMIMAMVSNVFAAGMASAERVQEVLETIPEVEDQPGARALPSSVPARLEFDNVSFHYNGTNDGAVLSQVSFTAQPGQTVAILGSTGAGKTSLVNLIPRFYDVTEGRVLIDGVDIRQLQQDALLSQIAVVPQETILFSGSVRDNIRYGRPEASEEEVVTAAKAAQAHAFIQEMPEGYDTRVEQRGVNLSGGQKQRIAIARAILTGSKILILDDSTSSVDVETENHIQRAFAELRQGCTNIVVAQRISTVLNADQIIVLDKGRVEAIGTHASLMKSSPIYQEIYDSQLGNGFAQSQITAGQEAEQ